MVSVIVVETAILQVAIRGKIDIGLSFDSSIWYVYYLRTNKALVPRLFRGEQKCQPQRANEGSFSTFTYYNYPNDSYNYIYLLR